MATSMPNRLFRSLSTFIKKLTRRTKIIIITSLVAVLFVVSVTGVMAYRYFQQNLYTDFYISGATFAGTSAAIELSKQHQNFVISEPTDRIGGQATTQGVTNFDEHGKVFQQNSVYAELRAANDPEKMPVALTSYMNSLIDTKYGKIIYHSRVKEVIKFGSHIDHVILETNDNQQYNVYAKFFLDSSDFAELGIKSGIPVSYGIDSQDQTNEKTALTTQERDWFENGFEIDKNNQKSKIPGFGNRIQPITTPFSMSDKGYTGIKYRPEDLGSKSMQFCPLSKQDKCASIAKNQTQNFQLQILSSQNQNLSIIIENKDIADHLDQIGISINGQKLDSLESFKHIDQDRLVLSFPVQMSDNGAVQVSISNLSDSPLLVNGFVLSEENKADRTLAQNLEELKKMANFIYPLAQSKTDGETQPESTGNKNRITKKLDTKNLDPNAEYYVIVTNTDNKVKYSNKEQLSVARDDQDIFQMTANINESPFPNYFPVAKFKFDPDKKYSFAIQNLAGGQVQNPDSVMVVPVSGVKGFRILNSGESWKQDQTVYSQLITLALKATGRVHNLSDNSNDIKLNSGNGELSVQSQLWFSKDTNYKYEGNDQSQLLVVNLNQNHYMNFVTDTFDKRKTIDIKTAEAGTFQVLALNLSQTSPRTTINIHQGSDTISNQFDIAQNVVTPIGEISSDTNPLHLEVTSDCPNQSCLAGLQIFFQEKQPENYNPSEFNEQIVTSNFDRPLLALSSYDNSFFRYRQSVLPQDLFASGNVSTNLKKSLTYNTRGITQVNTPFNDFSLNKIEIDKYMSDFNYRDSVNQQAKELSKRYYYWLRYDIPQTYLGCTDTELFCSGLRLNISPASMGTSDGYSVEPYVREAPRLQGEKTITYQNLAWSENVCSGDNQSCNDLQFNFYGSGNVQSKTVKVSKSFLTDTPQDSVAAFYYPADVHDLTDGIQERSNLRTYLQFLIDQKTRSKDNLPTFLGGLFESKVKSGSIELDDLHSSQVDNLLFCGKNISMTQLSNGMIRLHPGESAIGQSCADIATFLKENKLNKIDDLHDTGKMDSLRNYLVESGMRVLPLEDEEIETLFEKSKFTILQSYFTAIADGAVQVNPIQDEKKQYVQLKLNPIDKATDIDLHTWASQLHYTSPDTQSEVITLSTLKTLFPSKASTLESTIQKYHQDLEGHNVDQDYIIKRGDLAYLYVGLR